MPLTKWSKKRASATAPGWTAASPRDAYPRGGETLRPGQRKSWLHADESKMKEISLPHFSYSHRHPKAFWDHGGASNTTSFSPCPSHCSPERLSHKITLLLAWNSGCLDTHQDHDSQNTALGSFLQKTPVMVPWPTASALHRITPPIPEESPRVAGGGEVWAEAGGLPRNP